VPWGRGTFVARAEAHSPSARSQTEGVPARCITTAPRRLTVTGAGETGDLDLERGLHIKSERLAAKPLDKSSPGACATAA